MTKTTTPKINNRAKKQKGLQKTQRLVKVRLPQKKTKSAAASNAQARQAKLIKNDIKIMLANEVVRTQFPDKRTWTGNTSQIDTPKKPNPKTKNTRRVIKTENGSQENVQHSNDTEVDCDKTSTDKKIGCKILRRRENKNITKKVTCSTSKDDSTQVEEEISVPNRLRSRRTTKDTALANVNDKKQLQQPKKQTKSRATRSKLQVKQKPKETAEYEDNEDISEPALKEDNDIIDMDKHSSKSSLILRSDSRSSELSWTKNISSSATTSCITVSPNDFFTIDNKIPFVKLKSIDWDIKNPVKINQGNKGISACASDSASDSATSVLDKCVLRESCDDINISLPSLSLSTSSCDTCSMNKSEDTSEPVDKYCEMLKKISSKLKALDLEVINWMGHTNMDASHNSDLLNNEKIQTVLLKDERDVILTCKEMNGLLLDRKEETTNNDSADKEAAEGKNSEEKCEEINKTDQDISTKQTDVLCSAALVENDKANLTHADTDDEDTISLFAESITGLDTPKSNNSKAADDLHVTEEYVPEPISKCPFKTPEVRYQPTVISNRKTVTHNPVSDPNSPKQNSVSTSICTDRKITYGNRAYGNPNRVLNKEVGNGNVVSQPKLISSIHKPMQGVKSVVFRGVCFFYLISSCKNSYCKFPHTFIEIEDIRKKLSVLSEDLFVEEYMLVKSWPHLRRKYGQCFVDECIKRDLSRMLVEMSIDFVIKSNCSSKEDETLKTDVAEKVLLYLNDTELTPFTDLLTYKVQYSGVMLYEFFLSTISKSLNFSRFKAVFIKLTDFMSDLQKVVDPEAATHLLERISILPYDGGLAMGMMEVIKKTDQIIFANSLMGYFEKQLKFSNLNLYHELMRLKDNAQANSKEFERTYNKPHTEVSGQKQSNSSLVNEIITCPTDTTTFNNKSQPMVARTVDINQLGAHLKLQAENSNDGKTSKSIYRKWQNMSVFDKIRQRRLDQPVTKSRWIGSKYRLEHLSEAGPSKCQKTSGSQYFPDYY